jgi:hypothetical protein
MNNKYLRINVNDYVYVKLTDYAIEKIIQDNGYEYFKYCVESYKQEDGLYQLQIHKVMLLLGKYLCNGNKLSFENNTLYFDVNDLEEVNEIND